MDAENKYQTRVEISEDSAEILAELTIIKEIAETLGITVNKTDPSFPRVDHSSKSRPDPDFAEYYDNFWNGKIQSDIKEKF